MEPKPKDIDVLFDALFQCITNAPDEDRDYVFQTTRDLKKNLHHPSGFAKRFFAMVKEAEQYVNEVDK